MSFDDIGALDSELVLVCRLSEADRTRTMDLLSHAEVDARACDDIEEVCCRMRTGAAALLVDERLLDEDARRCLVRTLDEQGDGSDFPILVVGDGEGGEDLSVLGNVTFLEQPFHGRARSLVTGVRAAVRARKRQYECRRLVDAREQFLAMLAHELRNPVASIRLAIETMPHDTTAEVAKRRIVIDRQSSHLVRLLDELLDAARVTTGKIVIRRERVDMTDVVRSSVLAFGPSAERAGLDVSLHGDDVRRWVDGDRLRLEQIVDNVLTNAIKYTGEGTIRLELRTRGQDVELEVTDTGIGMTPAMCSRAFEMFAQADDSLERASGGVGLGLTVARRIAELHGGSVDAWSEGPGKGSTIRISLPAVEARAPTRTTPGSGEFVRVRSPKRVVIVDDNDDTREMLREAFVGKRYEVVTAVDGREGLAAINARRTDVAFVDLGLPLLDGYEVARRARAAGSEALLVAVSGYDQHHDRRRAVEAGFDEHMKKPMDLHRLESLIDRGRPTPMTRRLRRPA